MLKTPEHITQQFGIPPGSGQGRAVPRIFNSYSGPDKSKFLSVVYSMILARALPEQGQKRSWLTPVTQDELARMCGLASRSTYTRRVSGFSPPAADPAGNGNRAKNPAKNSARLPQEAPAGSPPTCSTQEFPGAGAGVNHKAGRPTFLLRQRRFAAPNIYSLAMPQKRDPEKPERYFAPDLQDLAKDASVARWWDPNATGWKGYKDVPRWLWDSRLPLTDTARLVMTFYIMCGLLDTDPRNGRVRGEVHPSQPRIAGALGISVRSVYNANRELAALGLVRVAHPKPTCEGGRYVRGPARIIYLPVRQLTHEEAHQERQRLLGAMKGIQDAQVAARASQLHDALLDAWTGHEHSLQAFWNEIRRQLLAAGIHRQLVHQLIPRPPD